MYHICWIRGCLKGGNCLQLHPTCSSTTISYHDGGKTTTNYYYYCWHYYLLICCQQCTMSKTLSNGSSYQFDLRWSKNLCCHHERNKKNQKAKCEMTQSQSHHVFVFVCGTIFQWHQFLLVICGCAWCVCVCCVRANQSVRVRAWGDFCEFLIFLLSCRNLVRNCIRCGCIGASRKERGRKVKIARPKNGSTG